jgi:hypothetical protein
VVLTGRAEPGPELLVQKMGGRVVRTALATGPWSVPGHAQAAAELRAASARACQELEGIAPRVR